MATGNYLFHTNLNMQCPICPKLHMFDKCAGLNTSTCQYPVIVIAPPAGSRKFGTYKWLWHIPPIFITLNAYCSPFAVFLKPPLAVSPGARSRSSLLAALIIIIIFFKLNRIFEGLNMLEKSRNFAHAPEVAKIYIWYGFKSGCGKMAR